MTIYEVTVEVLDSMAYTMPQMREFLSERTRKTALTAINAFTDNEYNWDGRIPEDLCMDCGMTKMVLSCPEWDYVIKIPFICDTSLGAEIDYCEVEAMNYELAEKFGLEHHFAACKRLPAYHFCSVDYDGDFAVIDIPLYMMEFAEVDEIATEDLCSDCYICDSADFSDDQKDAARIFSNYYTDSEVEDLVAFIDDNGINDIHGLNVGYIGGFPVLIDYSGYMG